MSPTEEFNYTRDIVIEGNVDYPHEFIEGAEMIQYNIEKNIKAKYSGDEFGFFVTFAIDVIYSHFDEYIQENQLSNESLENIGFAYGRYLVFHLTNGTELIYDMGSIVSVDQQETSITQSGGDIETTDGFFTHPGSLANEGTINPIIIPSDVEESIGGLIGGDFEVTDGFFSEAGLEGLYQENHESFMHTWSHFDDHISAMKSIFAINTLSDDTFLDESDTFDANSSMRLDIVNPDLIAQFDGLTLYQIQQQARGAYRDLIRMTIEKPAHMLSPGLENAIYDSIDTYTQMIMGVGPDFKGGATLFDKSSSEVELGISLSIERFKTPNEVIQNWLSIRSQINADNFQDTTQENRAYPFYVQSLNRMSYQKMLDLGATNDELLSFARAISGRDSITGESEWTYGPDHYDHETANTILGALIGMPQQERFNNTTDSQETENTSVSLIERLIINEDLEDITDETVTHNDSLNDLYTESQGILEKAGLEFPQYLNENFGGGEPVGEILTGKYSDLSLKNKLVASSISRFMQYLDQSVTEYDTQEAYQERLKANAADLSLMYGAYNQTPNLNIYNPRLFYQEGQDYFTIAAKQNTGGEAVYIEIPIEKITTQSAAQYYQDSLYSFVVSNDISGKDNADSYTSGSSQDTFTQQGIVENIPDYKYGTDENNLLDGFNAHSDLPDGYIDNIRNLSISQSFDHVSGLIMAKFDLMDTNSQEDEYLNPQNLDKDMFSKTDIDTLELWTDINGLGGLFEVSDGNQELMMQGAKIALIIALSAAAASLTMGVAAGGVMAARGAGMNLVRYSMASTKIANASGWAGRSAYGATMGFYAAPSSWVVYPHGYSSREEMYVDLLSDLSISTGTGAIGGLLRPGTMSTITDFTVLGLMTEAYRMKTLTDIYHPGENFLDDNEIGDKVCLPGEDWTNM